MLQICDVPHASASRDYELALSGDSIMVDELESPMITLQYGSVHFVDVVGLLLMLILILFF